MNKFGLVNLSNYSTPEIKEVRNKLWIEYGADNNYYHYLIDRYNGSPTNNAIINGLSEQIYGKGLNATNSNKKPDEYAQMISLFKKDIVRKFAYDLKLMGQCAIQVIYSKDRNRIAQVEHLPIETIRAEKVDENSGDVEAYYYHSDWLNIKPSEQPKRIPAFGTSNESIEILCVKPYRAGFYYYSPVDYQGALQYCELEEEIANYHLNNIKNGLAPSMLINFNNGIPNDEERELIEKRIYDKFSGTSAAGKFILSFNDNTESSANIEPVQLSDAHNQYQFLSDESSKKILVGHRIVSPMLFGIKDNTGLGNNAEELKTASILNDNVVVKPFQELLIDSFDKILAFNQITLNLYFETLQPLEFTQEGVEDVIDKEIVEEETGVKMSLKSEVINDDFAIIDDRLGYSTKEKALEIAKNIGCESYHEHEYEGRIWFMPCEKHSTNLSNNPDTKQKDLWLTYLKELGENEYLDDWELIDVEDSEDEPEDFNPELYLNELNLSANQESKIDTKRWKVRYKYVKGTKRTQKGKSRDFCETLVDLNKVYRKEDIDIMSFKSNQEKLGLPLHKGQPYSIFKFKGGVNCYHRWERRIYKKKLKVDGTLWGGNALQGTDFKNVNQAIREGWKINTQPKEVATAPIDMIDNGHHPNYNN